MTGLRTLCIPMRILPALLGLAAVIVPTARAEAQDAQGQWDVDQVIGSEQFVTPPATIADAAFAPRWLNVSLSNASPDKMWFLNEVRDGPVTMDVFSRPFDELGGLFIDPRANRSRSLTISNNVGIEIISGTDGSKIQVQLPRGARVSRAKWNPAGGSIAFLVHTDDATHIYVADAATGRSRQITRTPVLATLVTDYEWVDNGTHIATVLIPDNRPPRPVKPAAPVGPHVKVAEESDKNMLRTYASLMATPYDQELLEWHATGQLALIEVRNRSVTKVGQPDMIRELPRSSRRIDPSPDGQYLRIARMVKPFSYVVPVSSFGLIEEIWDRDGNVMAVLDTTELNLGVRGQPTAPGVGGSAAGEANRREMSWRPDGQGLTFLEQEPAPEGEDTANAAPPARGGNQAEGQGQQRGRRMNRVMQWLPPFDSTSLNVVYESRTRMSNHRFSPDMQILFLREQTGQNVREYAVRLSNPDTTYTLVRYQSDEFYENPGQLLMAQGGGGGGFGGRGGGGGGGTVLLSADGEHVFFSGTQYDRNPEETGPKNFIDRVNINDSSQKTRVYESDNGGVYERVATVQDIDAGRFIVDRESPTEITQSYLRVGDQLTQLTNNTDYTPDLTSAPRESFVVERPDGFRFKVNVMLPPGYQEGTRLPAMFWFYPYEYTDQEDYDEDNRNRRFNKNEFQAFTNIRSIQFLVRLGYAVVTPDAPIVGESGQENNNYENDLRNNLAAVIDEVDRRGFVDRTRIGIGGHSYGAFSTVNAMVHTPFFKAGIAGDGNYNRTLTPLNFQSERRILWDARDVYLGMSPFLYANNLTGALLMYHGMHDQNVGTDPTHSPRLFHALNGLGKTVSMYLYEFEDHGPATLETQLDLWARWTAWLDKYVKNAGKEETKVTTDEPVSEM